MRTILLLPLAGLGVFSTCQPAVRPPSTEVIRSGWTPEAGKNLPVPFALPHLPVVEPHLSVHPGNPAHLLLAAMVVQDKTNPYETSRLVSFVSEDNGRSWAQTDSEYQGYDPWTVILPDGKAVMTWLGVRGVFNRTPVQVFTSPDGGKTWNDEVQTLEGEYDGTKMTLDKKTNTVLFTSVKFKGHASVDIYFAKNPGATGFLPPTLIDGENQRLNFAQPVVLSDGTIVVPSVVFDQEARAHISADGGQTFQPPVSISNRLGGAKGYHQFVSDDSGSASFKDRIYYVRATGYDTSYQGIWLNYSADKGKTWSKDIRVDRFENPARCRALVPSAAVNREGLIGISWVDDQTGAGNDLYFAVSADGGETFQPPVRITDATTNPRTPQNDDVANKFPAGGHYLALAAKPDGAFHLAWSDSRTGVFQLQTCEVRVKRQ